MDRNKNIFIIDFSFSKGHKTLNNCYIKTLNSLKGDSFYVLNDGEYYNEAETCENVKLINLPFEKDGRDGRYRGRWRFIKNMKLAMNYLKQKKVDALIILTYEILTFGLFGRGFLKYNTYTFEHNSLDELQNTLKYFIFNWYKNRVCHLVLEEEFKDFLTEKCRTNNQKCFVIHHCLRKVQFVNAIEEDGFKRVVGLSNTISDFWIKQILENQKLKNTLIKNNIKLIIKAPESFLSDCDCIQLIQYYITDSEYDYWLQRSDSIIAFANGFTNRISGSYFDAISSKKMLIALESPVIRNWKRHYPSIVHTFHSTDELADIIERLADININKNEAEELKNRYSDEQIMLEWKLALERK